MADELVEAIKRLARKAGPGEWGDLSMSLSRQADEASTSDEYFKVSGLSAIAYDLANLARRLERND
jgi:hypothetical protein